MTSLPKKFSSKFEIHCELLFFSPNNFSSQKCNPGHVKSSFTNRAEKLSRLSAVIFWLHFKLSTEIHKRSLCLKMFLWNDRVLIWQYYQKFRQRSDIYAEYVEATFKLHSFHKTFLNVPLWMSLKQFGTGP